MFYVWRSMSVHFRSWYGLFCPASGVCRPSVCLSSWLCLCNYCPNLFLSLYAGCPSQYAQKRLNFEKKLSFNIKIKNKHTYVRKSKKKLQEKYQSLKYHTTVYANKKKIQKIWKTFFQAYCPRQPTTAIWKKADQQVRR